MLQASRARKKHGPVAASSAVYNRLDEMSRTKILAKARTESRRKLNTKTPLRTGSVLTGKKLITVLCVLVAAATTALYSPVIGHSFLVFDDRDYVVANSHIHDGLSWNTIKWAFASTEEIGRAHV